MSKPRYYLLTCDPRAVAGVRAFLGRSADVLAFLPVTASAFVVRSHLDAKELGEAVGRRFAGFLLADLAGGVYGVLSQEVWDFVQQDGRKAG